MLKAGIVYLCFITGLLLVPALSTAYDASTDPNVRQQYTDTVNQHDEEIRQQEQEEKERAAEARQEERMRELERRQHDLEQREYNGD